MHEPLPDGGMIRKLWISETDAYRDHLLRLDPESRHRRFSGAVSDEFIANHASSATGLSVVVHGFFVDGILRGAAELRRFGSMLVREGEAAFSIEQPWQSHGVGTVLLERTLLSARNRGIKSLQMHCLADNSACSNLPASSRPTSNSISGAWSVKSTRRDTHPCPFCAKPSLMHTVSRTQFLMCNRGYSDLPDCFTH